MQEERLLFSRHRRIRSNSGLRSIFAETDISIDKFILPIFVEEDIAEPVPIKEMPGVFRIPERELSVRIKDIEAIGVKAVILFGVSHRKDATGSDAMRKDGLLARMIRAAKEAAPSIVVVADVCFCEYTDHGHCGPLRNGDVENDETIENLARQSIVAAEAGADLVAPSAMMDGQVASIRRGLDRAGHENMPIMAYSTKFSSALYAPFRVAGGTSLKSGRDTYMLDMRNGREALRESIADEAEGADVLMVKPGIHCLDVIAKIRQITLLPLCAYHVSGEYAMWKFAAQAGAIDADRVLLETMHSFGRAGADVVITYAAEHVVRLLSR